MKITILGCGGSAGVPMIGGQDGAGLWGRCDPREPRNTRTRSSIVIEGPGGESLLVDSGPDLRTQFLAARIPAVHAVVYTHPHSDHVAGLDELRAVNRVIDAPLPLYAAEDVLEELRARFAYAFRPWQGSGFFRPVLETHLVAAGQSIRAAGLEVALFEQRHGRTTSLGLRCGAFAYCTDVEFMTDAVLDGLTGLDTWVVGCFQHEPHVAHAWVGLVLEWRERLKPRRTILTHMGPDMDYASLLRDLPAGVEPAYDGMVITVS
ncbi:MBL fold metallo-hydrolase [Acidomonas methanolica]|uniref:Metal dependent hydrolase PhnP n=1 Tax=Acidomonas methanolica NBRC 104435 TaxID=1231351 RepID=A0A023D5G5_ACIMT|nr:MBL fold metallo-hydrolase [Acidomonas methanolica]MBU2653191.1 MBL fold metallo-hydrolase [Acidomonas methanolica]TCS32140.1 phosphoribosyl 1,2-cyclic phosphate phosphodiesterase [Acidomonas methanolica]GAJ29382.1 metal dependent hydrolase PhnP [Acidomonas methanolica NBRC 104435]GBQ49997.1 metal-dependent hydrolase PhnP [Acidomonas methanolica]GEK97573.1 metal-dependent hydrolase [Acidomonas methanolica NBRC 104435]